MKKRKLTYIVLLIALGGFVVFFPWPIDQGHCCLGELAGHGMKSTSPMASNAIVGVDAARHYVFPYGLIWWMSIAAIYWSVKNLTGKNKRE